MGTIDPLLLDIGRNIQNANTIKNMVIGQLVTDKIITVTQSIQYIEKYHVITIKRNWFKKLTSKDKDKWEYRFVKMDI